MKKVSFETRYKRIEKDRKLGLVACDDSCKAKEEPNTLEEYKATLEHYKSHGYLSGCSHAC